MNPSLAERLNNLNTQNEIKSEAEGAYLLKKAEIENLKEDLSSIEYDLFLTTLGSIAERTAKARTSELYQQGIGHLKKMRLELAALQKRHSFEHSRFEILDKAFQATYLTLKREQPLIDKHGVIT